MEAYDESGDRHTLKWLAAVLIAGLALQVFLFLRSWLSADQVILLRIGVDFAGQHELHPVAKGMSGAGHIPGSLLQVLIGIPLMIYPHFKSPNVLVSLSHVAAGMVILLVLLRAMGTRFTVIYMGLYWLSPWRLYHSGFLWEPSLLYLPAALHLWACYRQRETSGFLPSAVLGTVLACTVQIHASFVILWVLTGILWARRRVRLRYAGFALGLAIGSATLIPTLSAFLDGRLPPITPCDGFIGRGFVYVFPVLKSALYWIRFSSPDAGQIISHTVFFDGQWAAAGPGHQVLAVTIQALYYLAIGAAVLCAVAVYRFFADFRRQRIAEPRSERAWLAAYAVSAFAAMLIGAGLSPVTPQGWHLIIILHAACISCAYWLDKKWLKGGRALRFAIVVLIVLRIPLALAVGMGHDRYRPPPPCERIWNENASPDLIEILPHRR